VIRRELLGTTLVRIVQVLAVCAHAFAAVVALAFSLAGLVAPAVLT
jgi:hypothetical protein